MNCARVNQVLDAWRDGELDAKTSGEVRHHVDSCPVCAALEADRTALSKALREGMPYHAAPAALKTRIRKSLDRSPAAPRRRPTWLQTAALAGAAAGLSALVTFWAAQGPADTSSTEQVVASHVASLAGPRSLVTAESGERHVVKPWFQGKVDFAPAVKDLSEHQFVLLGARVDHVGDAQAAAIVYRIRSHMINLFVWRSSAGDGAVAETRSRGFSVATWTEGGLRYSAISDVDPADLRRFAELVRGR